MPIFVGNSTVNTEITNTSITVMDSLSLDTINNTRNPIQPTFIIDFSSQPILDPRVTYLRTGPASRYNAQGVMEILADNMPRFDYDPITKRFKGLLLESGSVNRLLRSEEFSNSVWIKTNCTITANSTTSPTGLLTASTFTATAANAELKQQLPINSQAIARQWSIFAKRKTGTGNVIIRVGGFSNSYTLPSTTIWERLVSGRPITKSGTYTVVSNIVTVTSNNHGFENGDNMRTQYTAGTATNINVTNITVIDANTFSYAQTTADTSGTLNFFCDTIRLVLETNGDEIYIWGAQSETYSSPTSYVPTTTAVVTRNFDNISYNGNMAEWYNPIEGTLYREFDWDDYPYTSSGVNVGMYCGFSDFANATSNNMYMRNVLQNANNSYVDLVVYNSNTLVVDTQNLGQNVLSVTTMKQAFSYKENDFRVCFNGNTIHFDTAALVPSVNTFVIGGNLANSSALAKGYLKKIIYFPRSFTNTELISLTRTY